MKLQPEIREYFIRTYESNLVEAEAKLQNPKCTVRLKYKTVVNNFKLVISNLKNEREESENE